MRAPARSALFRTVTWFNVSLVGRNSRIVALPVVLQRRPAMASSTDAPQGADFVGLGGDHRLLEVMKQSLSLCHRQPYRFGIEHLTWPVNAAHLDRLCITPVGNQFDANDDFHRDLDVGTGEVQC